MWLGSITSIAIGHRVRAAVGMAKQVGGGVGGACTVKVKGANASGAVVGANVPVPPTVSVVGEIVSVDARRALGNLT